MTQIKQYKSVRLKIFEKKQNPMHNPFALQLIHDGLEVSAMKYILTEILR